MVSCLTVVKQYWFQTVVWYISLNNNFYEMALKLISFIAKVSSLKLLNFKLPKK